MWLPGLVRQLRRYYAAVRLPAVVHLGLTALAFPEQPALPSQPDGLDTVLTETYSVWWPDAPHRVLRSAVEAAKALDHEFAGDVGGAGEPFPIPRFGPSSSRPARPFPTRRIRTVPSGLSDSIPSHFPPSRSMRLTAPRWLPSAPVRKADSGACAPRALGQPGHRDELAGNRRRAGCRRAGSRGLRRRLRPGAPARALGMKDPFPPIADEARDALAALFVTE